MALGHYIAVPVVTVVTEAIANDYNQTGSFSTEGRPFTLMLDSIPLEVVVFNWLGLWTLFLLLHNTVVDLSGVDRGEGSKHCLVVFV